LIKEGRGQERNLRYLRGVDLRDQEKLIELRGVELRDLRDLR